MTFRGEIDNGAGLVARKQIGNKSRITDIAMYKGMPLIRCKRGEILHIARIRKYIEVDNGFVGLPQPIQHKICADEPGTARN